MPKLLIFQTRNNNPETQRDCRDLSLPLAELDPGPRTQVSALAGVLSKASLPAPGWAWSLVFLDPGLGSAGTSLSREGEQVSGHCSSWSCAAASHS